MWMIIQYQHTQGIKRLVACDEAPGCNSSGNEVSSSAKTYFACVCEGERERERKRERKRERAHRYPDFELFEERER